MATMETIENTADTYIVEWADLRETDTDADIPVTSRPDLPEMTCQLLEVTGTTPDVRPEFSLNVGTRADGTPDTPVVWAPCNKPDGVAISLKAAGEGNTILESGQMMRLKVNGGTGIVARGRIKFSRNYGT